MRLKDWTISLLQSVGLVHDPDKAPPHAWGQSVSGQDKTKTKRPPMPNNIVYNAGTPFTHEDTKHGFEEKIWKGRVPVNEDGDRDSRTPNWFEERKLDANKYEVILHCRNMGMTQQETSEELQRRFKAGFKLRTVQKYWPHLPPIGEVVE